MMTMNEIRAKRMLNDIKGVMDYLYMVLINLKGSYMDYVTPAHKAKKMASKYFDRVAFYDKIRRELIEKYPASVEGIKIKDLDSFESLYNFFK